MIERNVCDDDASESDSRAARAREELAENMLRPFYMIRPSMTLDGNQWCALYGENIQTGVCGFGDTPEAASRAFDIAWTTPCWKACAAA